LKPKRRRSRRIVHPLLAKRISEGRRKAKVLEDPCADVSGYCFISPPEAEERQERKSEGASRWKEASESERLV